MIELKSSGENSENNDEETGKNGEEIKWYEHFPGFKNLWNFDKSMHWNRLVIKIDIADDALSIIKALGKL